MGKSQQLQIRVTPAQKAAIRRLARNAGQDISSYVLARAVPEPRLRLAGILRALADEADPRFALAELNDLLAGLSAAATSETVTVLPEGVRELPPFLQNYVAAMIEHSCHGHGIPSPAWVRATEPLEAPYFAAPLPGLRLHLLRSVPVSFKRRNIFVDSTVGDRV